MLRTIVYGLMATTFLATGGAAFADVSENPLPGAYDEEPVVLSGTINEIRDDEFDLSYGTGKITVELDGWGWTGEETRYLRVGDRVTVSGHIDDDLFEGREIKADNLYLPDAFVYYYRTEVMPSYSFVNNNGVSDGSFVSTRGTVTDIDGDELTIVSSNNASMKVDVGDLGYDPFDDMGVQKIRVGDPIYVYGQIDDDFFEEREIDADTLISLSQTGSGIQQESEDNTRE